MSQRWHPGQMAMPFSSPSLESPANRLVDEWAGQHAQRLPLTELRNSYIGIDASYWIYLKMWKPNNADALQCALGGTSNVLQARIEKDLDAFKELDITPVFFFHGLEVAAKDAYKEDHLLSMQKRGQAWAIYDRTQRDGANDAVRSFSETGSIRPEDNYRFVQHILWKRNISFFVAPYTAWSQLAYFSALNEQFIDAVMGSTELFMFGVDKVIKEIDVEQSTFTWVTRSKLIESLGDHISDDVFLDALLLSGSAYLPMFPHFENGFRRSVPIVKEATQLIMAYGRSGYAAVRNFQEDKNVAQLNYIDRFKRSRMAIKHGVYFTIDGKVEPHETASVPSDLYSIVGQRLPDELYYYLQQGLCSPRVLNWRTSGYLIEIPPLDNGDYDEYRNFVRRGLTPLRRQAVSLLANTLHNFYRRKPVEVKYWWDPEIKDTIVPSEIEPSPTEQVSKWFVQKSFIAEAKKIVKSEPGTLRFCLDCLSHPDLMAKTIISGKQDGLLNTKEEVMTTAIFRLLQLRDYVDSKTHLPTPAGKAVLAIISSLATNASKSVSSEEETAEQSLLSVELIRNDLLVADALVPGHYSGRTLRGTEEDKRFALLVSRTACVLPLRHKAIGYSGPLSRTLLAHHSVVTGLRTALRDLVEMIIIGMLLPGITVDRESLLSPSPATASNPGPATKTAYQDIGMQLPFLSTGPSSSLSVAVKQHLDETSIPESLTEKEKEEALHKGETVWFQHATNYREDVNNAFDLAEAVLGVGVSVLAKEGVEDGVGVRNAKECEDAVKWLKGRR